MVLPPADTVRTVTVSYTHLVNATRLVVRALELRILNIDNLEADDE